MCDATGVACAASAGPASGAAPTATTTAPTPTEISRRTCTPRNTVDIRATLTPGTATIRTLGPSTDKTREWAAQSMPTRDPRLMIRRCLRTKGQGCRLALERVDTDALLRYLAACRSERTSTRAM